MYGRTSAGRVKQHFPRLPEATGLHLVWGHTCPVSASYSRGSPRSGLSPLGPQGAAPAGLSDRDTNKKLPQVHFCHRFLLPDGMGENCPPNLLSKTSHQIGKPIQRPHCYMKRAKAPGSWSLAVTDVRVQRRWELSHGLPQCVFLLPPRTPELLIINSSQFWFPTLKVTHGYWKRGHGVFLQLFSNTYKSKHQCEGGKGVWVTWSLTRMWIPVGPCL